MDPTIQRSLNDKLYDRRKLGALELERVVRECVAHDDNEKVRDIISQLCLDFAYAVHQPHARNGGLIGLAAASIALGPVGIFRSLFATAKRLTAQVGGCSIPGRDSSACIGVLCRSGCEGQILCM